MSDARAQERIQALARRLQHPDPSQLWFQLAEIAGEQIYLRHGIEVGEDDVVLDVGANVGVAAAFFAVQCGARVVHSFEPVRPVCELLRKNVSGLPACVVHEQGLSRASGESAITYYPGAAAMSGLYADPQRDRALVRAVLANLGVPADEADARLANAFEPLTLRCELRTLSSFLREEALARVDLLKIDVERAELDVLAGIDEADWPVIAQVVVEVHDEGGRLDAISGTLVDRGFRVAHEQDPAMRGTDVQLVYATRP
ncbi:MAG TPA: FkbM family methyltransferase [Myxococcota bacterium]|jgi:FkbM family methyltransferase|nr:FkbM family methyltransferase [Myxococcota bacterium]